MDFAATSSTYTHIRWTLRTDARDIGRLSALRTEHHRLLIQPLHLAVETEVRPTLTSLVLQQTFKHGGMANSIPNANYFKLDVDIDLNNHPRTPIALNDMAIGALTVSIIR